MDAIQDYIEREIMAKPSPATAEPTENYALHNITPNGILIDNDYTATNTMTTIIDFEGYSYGV